MSQTIQLRQENPDEEEKMAKLEEPDNRVYGYLKRSVANQLGNFFEVTISEEADVTASEQKTTSNYGVYETPGGAVVGLGVNKDILESFTDEDETPDSIGLTFAASDEESYEEVVTELEEEAEDEEEALISGESDSDESEEEIEISDEELDLVAE